MVVWRSHHDEYRGERGTCNEKEGQEQTYVTHTLDSNVLMAAFVQLATQNAQSRIFWKDSMPFRKEN